jgi:DNA mismatch repair protein MutS
MTIHDEYIFYHNKNIKKYGEKTIVLMQVGSFFEMYQTDEEGPDLQKMKKIVQYEVTKKNKSIPEVSMKNPYLLGIPCAVIEKKIAVIINSGYTIVLIEEVTPQPNVERKITKVLSVGTYIDGIEHDEANNLLSIYIEFIKQLDGGYLPCVGISNVDLSTGKVMYNEIYSKKGDQNLALDDAVRFIYNNDPKEIVLYYHESKKLKDIKNIMNRDDVIKYLELADKNVHVIKKFGSKYDNVEYQNNFFKQIYPNTGMMSCLEYLDLERKQLAAISIVMMLDYAYQHDNSIIGKLYKPVCVTDREFLVLENNALYQLDVISSSTTEFYTTQFKSLFDVVNKTSTAMGKRFLKNTLMSPLTDQGELNIRYNTIEKLLKKLKEKNHKVMYHKFEVILEEICDIERIHRKMLLNKVVPFDLFKLIQSYRSINKILELCDDKKIFKEYMDRYDFGKGLSKFLKECLKTFNISALEKVGQDVIDKTFFKAGVHKDIDKMQNELSENVTFMDKICEVLSDYIPEKKKTKGVKIKKEYTSSNGFYLTLTQKRSKALMDNIEGNIIQVTDKYSISADDITFDKSRKGSVKLVLEQMNTISNSIDHISKALEKRVNDEFVKTIDKFNNKYSDIYHIIIDFVSTVDFLISSAKTANLYNYSKPKINDVKDHGYLKCEGLRHPIIERINDKFEYVPHNIKLSYYKDIVDNNKRDKAACEDTEDDNNKRDKATCEDTEDDINDTETTESDSSEYSDSSIFIKENIKDVNSMDNMDGMLVFGCNSVGKSSMMKAIGLSVIMAQSGMYVPASYYEFSPYHYLFARITGNDNIFKGLSSFALEMTELNAIIKRIGPKTLVIGDEVCRGTEYQSGTAIVAATITKLSEAHVSFMFATHLHDIPKMTRIKKLKNVKSFHLTVDYDEKTGNLVFDRIIKPGSGKEVYGVTIARHIIQDKDFIKLSREILNEVSNQPKTILTSKTSNYNSKIFMDKCGICRKKGSDKTYTGFLETHHINEQKNCLNGFVKDKPHVPMNSPCNLIAICKKCHLDVHNGLVTIDGIKSTTSGPMLMCTFNKNKKQKIKK